MSNGDELILGELGARTRRRREVASCFRQTVLSATPLVGLRQVHSVSRHLSESCTSGIRSNTLPSRLRKGSSPAIPQCPSLGSIRRRLATCSLI